MLKSITTTRSKRRAVERGVALEDDDAIEIVKNSSAELDRCSRR